MSYTGTVAEGGPSDVRELRGLTIRKTSVGPTDNNCYLLTCTNTGEQMLIDAANDADRLQRLAAEGTGEISTILTTHRHPDHVRALKEMARRTGATTLAGRYDADALPVEPAVRLEHGDEVTLGDLTFEVIHLRGHTPGAVALTWTEPDGDAHLFVGDSLFPGGVGNTFGNEEHFRQLIDDVEERLFGQFGDAAWVYPGHGLDTTLGAERPHLGEWRARGW